MDARPIGVFDSGVGGLTVLKALCEVLPHEQFVYVGDTARVPYGNKNPDTLRRYALQCTDVLKQKDVKLIVVACNTLSATVMDAISSDVDVPVIGMINPAVREALRVSTTGHIGLIATRATIRSRAYDIALREFSAPQSVQVMSHACPLFVPLAEEGFSEHPSADMIAETYLAPFRDVGSDTLILGCTHFPILRDVIARALPNVQLIESGGAAALEVLDLLQANNTLGGFNNTSVSVYLSDITPTFKAIANRFLGQQPDRVEKISFS